MCRGDGLHAFQCFQPALRLFGFGGLGAKTFDVGFDVFYVALLFDIFRLLVSQPFGAYAFKRRVVAGVKRDGLMFQMRDVGADII